MTINRFIFIFIVFLIKPSFSSDSTYIFDPSLYPSRLLFIDSLVNRNIFDLLKNESTVLNVNGYILIKKPTLAFLINDKDVDKLYVKTHKKQFELQSWVLKDGYLIDDNNRMIQIDEINYLEIIDKLKLSRLLYFPFVSAAFFGMMPAMWECVDYLFGGNFNKTEVLSFCAVGFTVGIVGSFSRDKKKIVFRLSEAD